jgi:spore maturation protein CgeB
MMKILYLGADSGTSGHRANALRRLGHEVTIVNPVGGFAGIPMSGRWQRYLGGVGLAALAERYVLKAVAGERFDLVWVDGGQSVSGSLVRALKKSAGKVINYNVDDPYGARDVNTWFQYRRAIPQYDMMVVVREENVAEAEKLGARKVLRVYRSADEVAHAPRVLTEEERVKWASEVLFVGTAFPDRGAFFAELIERGVPLSIYGNRWDRLKEWKTIEPYWRGAGIDDAYRYSTAILAAKVCLGLLSKENRDLHTTRSLEIPSLGGVFCAERTVEHLKLYREDVEAVFWSGAEECAAQCKRLLADDAWRVSVGVKGHERYLENGWTNMQVGEMVLRAAFE